MPNFNIEQARKDTPGCSQVLHFNNAGASLPPHIVTDSMKRYLDLEANMGGYEAAHVMGKQLDTFYDLCAQLIHCSRDEIAFMENATRAWDMIFYSFHFKPGDKILTCIAEYASNYLAFLQQAKRTGVEIVIINNDEKGQLDIQDMESKLDKRVKLIAITHIPTQGGLINPVAEVGTLAQQYHIPYLLDATQSIGQMPLDVQAIKCDFLCATGRKYLRGPRGTGFLFAKKTQLMHLDPPFIDLHAARWDGDNHFTLSATASRFENWEQNMAGKIGLGKALAYALNIGIPVIWARVQYLATELRKKLSAIKGVTLQDLGLYQCGIVTFTAKGKTPQEIQAYLASKKINVSVSLQEYARLDLVNRNLPALVRASVHYYNNDAEIEAFCAELETFLA